MVYTEQYRDADIMIEGPYAYSKKGFRTKSLEPTCGGRREGWEAMSICWHSLLYDFECTRVSLR